MKKNFPITTVRRKNFLHKKYCLALYLLMLLSIPGYLFGQNEETYNFYFLKSNWGVTKNIDKATYFMQLIKENDTAYTCRYYNKNGSMVRQEVFLDSGLTVPNGRFCWYDKQGNLDSTGWVYRGKNDGTWRYYNDNLKPDFYIAYDKGHFVEKKDWLSDASQENQSNHTEKEIADDNTLNENNPETKINYRKASFGNTDSAWKDYLKKNITPLQRFPNSSEPITGIATCAFTINKDGNIEDIYMVHSCEWSADAEVLNVIRKSPQWQSAAENENKVSSDTMQSVTFYSFPQWNSNGTVTQKSAMYIGSRVEARFPGGMQAWINFLQRNLDADVPARNNAPAGYYTVIISFLVQEDGSVEEITPLNDPGYGTMQEAIRAFEKCPKWIPAMQNGKPVIYRQKQSFTFAVSVAR